MKTLRYDPKNLLTSLVLVFPLFLVYQFGVLFTLPMLNGADFLTVFLFRNLGLSTGAYLAYTAAVAVAFVIAVAMLRRKQRFDPKLIVPVFVESAIYALTMGSLIVFVMTRVLHVSPRLAGGIAGQGLGTRFVMSLGAGVWEEAFHKTTVMLTEELKKHSVPMTFHSRIAGHDAVMWEDEFAAALIRAYGMRK